MLNLHITNQILFKNMKNDKKEDKVFEYDKVPYQSFPFSYVYPPHLKALAKVFGIEAPKIETARVLELGSSSGNNIIPFASFYPNSECIAIDLSTEEIEEGHLFLKKFPLKNLDLKVANILDVDESWGKFDYILCHGIWSWVPEIVRQKIFDISKHNLSPKGISYISYNIKPGWNMGNSIRDMMTYHATNFESPSEKIEQAKAFLNFVSEVLEGSDTPFAQYLKSETGNIKKKQDSYIYGEYLVEHNYQIYFKDFIKHITKRDLQYLSDTHLNSMYLGNLPPKAVEKLSVINDIVKTEQYMDFIQNRRFRCTLAVHKDQKIMRKLSPESLNDMLLTFSIYPEKPLSEVDLEDNLDSVHFYYQNNKDSSLKTSSKILKALFYTFSENISYPLTKKDIAKQAMKKIKNVQLKDIINELDKNLLQLIFQGFINIYSEKPLHINQITEKPKLHPLAIEQYKTYTNWTTNMLNESIQLNDFDQFLIPLLDGKNNLKDLEKKLLENTKLQIHIDNRKIDSKEEKREIISKYIKESLESYKSRALLIG